VPTRVQSPVRPLGQCNTKRIKVSRNILAEARFVRTS
jgi:hypothetical protein